MYAQSHEFKVMIDINKDMEVPIYTDLTEEEIAAFRKDNPGACFIPKRVKTGTTIKNVVVKKDVIVKRTFHNIHKLAISEYIKDNGKIAKNRFVVEENDRAYIVKGKYGDFIKYLDKLKKRKQIGYGG